MTTATLTDADLAAISSHLESAPASEIVAWAVETFGDGLCLAASMADAVLIDVATRVHPSIEVVFLDTQYHFPETLATADRVKRRYKLELRVLTPDRDPDDLWRTDTDACCDARKVQPMAKHLATRTAWMSGLRRAESDSRRDAAIVSHDSRGLVKINPLATWSDAQVDAYIAENDVPVNPLLFDGYPSIGCWPCTRRVEAGEDARAGRWAGSSKTECGLNT
jgi:phosphoadenosine phosphosulfate reductase